MLYAYYHHHRRPRGRVVRFAVTAPGLRIVGTALTRRWPPTDTTAFLGSGDRAARAEAATAAARRIYAYNVYIYINKYMYIKYIIYIYIRYGQADEGISEAECIWRESRQLRAAHLSPPPPPLYYPPRQRHRSRRHHTHHRSRPSTPCRRRHTTVPRTRPVLYTVYTAPPLPPPQTSTPPPLYIPLYRARDVGSGGTYSARRATPNPRDDAISLSRTTPNRSPTWRRRARRTPWCTRARPALVYTFQCVYDIIIVVHVSRDDVV